MAGGKQLFDDQEAKKSMINSQDLDSENDFYLKN